MSITLKAERFSHYVVDTDGFKLREFRCYQSAKHFVEFRPEYMVKKIKINLGIYEECLF